MDMQTALACSRRFAILTLLAGCTAQAADPAMERYLACQRWAGDRAVGASAQESLELQIRLTDRCLKGET